MSNVSVPAYDLWSGNQSPLELVSENTMTDCLLFFELNGFYYSGQSGMLVEGSFSRGQTAVKELPTLRMVQ